VRIQKCQVLAATVDTCIGRVPAGEYQFQQVFLDEAAYCNYVKAATLFSYKCPIAIIGDHKQLPPVCEMPFSSFSEANNNFASFWAIPSIFLTQQISFEQAEQVFHRYMSGAMPSFKGIAKTDLTQTYRFGQELAATLDEYVYKNGFKGCENAKTRLYFINAPMIKDAKKNTSPAECSAITAYCNSHPKENIAILTPYVNQRKLLFREPLKYIDKADNILTIHGSQGREWDTVIISVVDAAKKWFMSTQTPGSRGEQVINTAVSRAKKKLIIVCDTSFWKSDKELLGRLLQQAVVIDMAEWDDLFADLDNNEMDEEIFLLPEALDPNDFFKGCTTPEEIKKRYRQLMKKYHPDKSQIQGGNDEYAKRINEQYEMKMRRRK